MSGQSARASVPQVAAVGRRERMHVGSDEIVIGKDILELLTSAMYVDPMSIYREYIQNAADSIDEARAQDLLDNREAGRVEITFDQTTRGVRIRDNGVGIGGRNFVRRLTALGASGKRGTSARGFRGVGRLAGLGYAQELIFRSRVGGEKRISELTWDCRQLRASLRSADVDTGISGLIQSMVTTTRFESDKYPERFFEVELRGIVRLRSDRLMNPAAVSEYLSQVAPVPFSPDFQFGDRIRLALKKFVNLGEINIQVVGIDRPVYRPHQNAFMIDDRRSVSFERLEILEIPGMDGDVAGIAWVLHHDYEGGLPTNSFIKGLRLRSGNVQVGDHTLLEELFPEPRFNGWSVGEVHVLDRRIVPNGRRDHFEQNTHFHNLTNHLSPITRNIARLCRSSSIKRRWVREYESQRDGVRERINVIQQRSLPAKDKGDVALAAERGLVQMDKIGKMDLFQDDDALELSAATNALRAELSAVMEDLTEDTSPLARLPVERRNMYEHLFALIYECSSNRVAAKSLIDRILLKVT